MVELISFCIIQVYYKLPIDDGRNPVQYSDATIAELYGDKNLVSSKEMLKEMWSREQSYEPLVEHAEQEISGKFVNISEIGFRFSENQKKFLDKNNINIFFFGGSTMFGTGVRDEDTIASYVQKYLDTVETDKPVAIFNFGAGYYYSTVERIQLFKMITGGIKPDN